MLTILLSIINFFSSSAFGSIVNAVTGVIGKLSSDQATEFAAAAGAERDLLVARTQADSQAYQTRVALLRGMYPGGHNTLDDLCARYGVDRSRRTQHGALLDAELLAAVYVELTTTLQATLQLDPIKSASASVHAIVRARPQPLPPRVTWDDRNAHGAFMRTLGGEAVWLDHFAIKTVAA